jgi:hypothetical protein
MSILYSSAFLWKSGILVEAGSKAILMNFPEHPNLWRAANVTRESYVTTDVLFERVWNGQAPASGSLSSGSAYCFHSRLPTFP